MDSGDQDYYDDAPQGGSEENHKPSEAPTATLPLSAFGGSKPKPGDQISCQVVGITEQGVEVRIAEGDHDPDDMMR